MTEKQSTMVELLKYPVLVFSVLLALVALKELLGLEFGMVTEVTTQGVKFAAQSQATLEALSSLEASVNESLVRIQALEDQVQAPPAETQKIESEAFSAAQMVSDATANIARIREEAFPGKVEQAKGHIWIGNYNAAWDPTKLVSIETGQPITLPPQRIEPGSRYRIIGNMVLREGLPANDGEYYRGRASLGVVPRGSIVEIRRKPVGIDREFAVQYWAEIEVIPERTKK